MTLSSETAMKLMAYADGELEAAELDEVETLVATDAEAARFVAQIAGLGEIVARGYEGTSGKTVAKFDVADAVMALTAQSTPVNVTSLAQAREKRSALKAGAAIAAALALAAAVFLMAQHRTDETPMAKGPSAPSSSGAVAASGDGTGVEVTTLESAGNSVSVFYLPTANELSTSVVVWVDEPGEK